jgi:hypothetical protein
MLRDNVINTTSIITFDISGGTTEPEAIADTEIIEKEKLTIDNTIALWTYR